MNNQETEFARLVRENRSTIYTVCYMFSKDEEEVNDLFQETLINLWKGYDSFLGKSKVSTWIYRVAMIGLVIGASIGLCMYLRIQDTASTIIKEIEED